jgi:exodeoxyribonuclease V alpha subunit
MLKTLLAGRSPDSLPPEFGPQRAIEVIGQILTNGKAATLVGSPGEYKPLVYCPPYLYLQKMLTREDRFTEVLGRHLRREATGISEALAQAKLAEVLRAPAVRHGRPVRLTDEQQRAICTAVHAPMTVISGGPGTGKTTIVVSILRVLSRLGVHPEEIALAAPTGKAANRMGEAIRQGLEGIAQPDAPDRALSEVPSPRTLHRLLGYSPGSDRFQHHENNRLSEKVVVVDEGSMIDLFLMERLVRSLRDDAHFILLGDAEQLPSVEAGAVLRDLMLGRPSTPGRSLLGDSAVALTQSYRMDPSDPAGRNILTVAQHINNGEAEALFAAAPASDEGIQPRACVANVAFDKVEFVSTEPRPGILEEFLERWYQRFVRSLEGFDGLTRKTYRYGRDGFSERDRRDLALLFQHFDGFRLLCLTQVFKSGAARVNAILHARVLDDAGVNRAAAYHAGEPIMMQINDYEKMIFNGDQGLVLWVARDRETPHLMAVFPRAQGYGVFHLDTLRAHIKVSFAMTVHKSQGSEFDHVGLILPQEDMPINTREILYTAVTRSRRSVTVLGIRDVFEKGVAKQIRRYSGVADKLAAVF